MGVGPATGATRAVMALLATGVPLTLLLDLVDPRGPRSREILAAERGALPLELVAG